MIGAKITKRRQVPALKGPKSDVYLDHKGKMKIQGNECFGRGLGTRQSWREVYIST